MQRLSLEITDQNVLKDKDTITYSLRGNGIKFEISMKENERSPENMEKMNESFRNCLRYVLHFGGFPDKEHEDPKAMMKDLQSKWSSTNTGIGIKPIDDPISMFKPF